MWMKQFLCSQTRITRCQLSSFGYSIASLHGMTTKSDALNAGSHSSTTTLDQSIQDIQSFVAEDVSWRMQLSFRRQLRLALKDMESSLRHRTMTSRRRQEESTNTMASTSDHHGKLHSTSFMKMLSMMWNILRLHLNIKMRMEQWGSTFLTFQ